MSIYCHVVKDMRSHSEREALLDSLSIAYELDLMFSYLNNKVFENGCLRCFSANIARARTQISQENEEQFELVFQALQPSISFDAAFDWAGLGVEMQSLMYVTFVSDENSRLLLEFMYEYLKKNTDVYLWFEGSRVFSHRDLFELRSSEFDYEWYLKK